jgi:hypothetical protein
MVALAACHERPRVLAPDLVVDFGCRADPSRAAIMMFMAAHHFSAFDEESARRRHGKAFFPLQIEGYDNRSVMLDVIGLRKPKSYGSGVDYRLTITSPPPTHHDTTLESNALQFVRITLGCEVHDVRRFENDAGSVSLFKSIFEDVQGRIHER